MNTSIDTLRRRAKILRKAYESGDTVAIQRLSVYQPSLHNELKHADFLHVVAREEGFKSWPDLKLAADMHGLDHAQKLQRLKIALYHGQLSVIEQLLEQTPNLADGHFELQVALLNLPVVESMLREKPTRAIELYGPRRPILHLAFSRYIHARPELADDMLTIASLLIEQGADVNDSCPVAPGNDHQLSALYGAVGHANNMQLARWLLEQGANPNDGESLYHSTELDHHEGLKMLLEYGAEPEGTNALSRAIDFHDVEAVQLLLDHGAGVDDFSAEPVGGEFPWVIPALHQAARRLSAEPMIELLLENGADPASVYEGGTAYGYARVYGNDALARAIETRTSPPELTQEEASLARAANNQSTNGQYINPERLPPAYRNIIRAILHLPDKLEHIQNLVALGVEYDRPDIEGLTPVQAAGWEGLPDMMSYLLSLKPDLAHLNNYGGTLLSTIIHGSENCPTRATRDHIACAQLALEQGVALPTRAIELAGDDNLRDFLADWAQSYPGQVVQGGNA